MTESFRQNGMRLRTGETQNPHIEESVRVGRAFRAGRFLVYTRTDGRFALVDPDRPWNDALVSVHLTRPDAEKAAGLHPAWFNADLRRDEVAP